MNWERRLRGMILAGGALAATACNASTVAPVDAATTTSNDGFTSGADASTDDISGDDGSSHDAGFTVGPPCCNANSDPCCGLACLGATEASQNECEQGRTLCASMDGIYEHAPDGSIVCFMPLFPADAATDAADDANTSGAADAAGE